MMDDWKTVVGEFVGKPFAWNGRGPDAYDCWGLVEAVLNHRQIPLPTESFCVQDLSAGQNITESLRIMEDQISGPTWKRTDDLAPGVVLAMSIHKRIHHVGVVTPFGVLHVASGFSARLQSIAQLRASGFRRIEGYQWVG